MLRRILPLTLLQILLACADTPIAINGESFKGMDPSFVDDGGSRCSCDGSDTTCKVLSSDLQVPMAPDGFGGAPPPNDGQGSAI